MPDRSNATTAGNHLKSAVLSMGKRTIPQLRLRPAHLVVPPQGETEVQVDRFGVVTACERPVDQPLAGPATLPYLLDRRGDRGSDLPLVVVLQLDQPVGQGGEVDIDDPGRSSR